MTGEYANGNGALMRMNANLSFANLIQQGIDTAFRYYGKVVDSMMASVWCLITTKSYRECVLAAVNLGEDTDTTAAIAGGLAGLYYGEDKSDATGV